MSPISERKISQRLSRIPFLTFRSERVYGPYIDGVAYKAVKVLDKKVIPDSVDSRHILIRAETPDEVLAATKNWTVIKTVIEAGAGRFDSLAMRVSQDGSGPKGGGLGWSAPAEWLSHSMMYCFIPAEPGELNIVTTQFGVHLIEITGRKYIDNEQGVKLGLPGQSLLCHQKKHRQPSMMMRLSLADKTGIWMSSRQHLKRNLN